jgi:RND family efflux transporter MFP subunit
VVKNNSVKNSIRMKSIPKDLALAALALAGLALSAVGCAKEQPYVKPLTPVKVQTVEMQSAAEGPRYSGSIEPASRTDMAFRLGGYVESIFTIKEGASSRLVHEGDVVTKGTVMVKLRDSDYKVKVDQATSQVDQAKAALAQTEAGVKQAQVGVDKATLDYNRADALFKKQSLTKVDMEGAKAQLDNASAVLGGAKAQLPLARARIAGAQGLVDEANLALKDSSLTAPCDCVVIKRLVEPGSLAGPGTPAFVLANLTTMKAVFGAPDVLLSKLHLGMPIALSTDAYPAIFNGRITSIASAADPRSRVFDVEISFGNPGLRLKPGMIVAIQLPGGHTAAPAPALPLNAIVRSKSNSEGYSVFVVDEQANGKGIAHSRAVTLGGALNDSIIVNSGVKAGDRIVVTGATLISDGETVQIVP